jgi:spore coat protein U-like protein
MGYFLYQNSGRTTVFGGDAPTGVGQTGTGGNASLTVFGQVTGGQNVAPGSYADTVYGDRSVLTERCGLTLRKPGHRNFCKE